MTAAPPFSPLVAIACGGTGGHLFPGLAVGEQLLRRGCRVELLVSSKAVDKQAVQNVRSMGIITLPAVGLTRGKWLAFGAGLWRSYQLSKETFRRQPPQAALAMGGFTSASPILAAKRLGAHTFLHESNSIPGRANRWLSRVVDQAFVGFPSAAHRLHGRPAVVTGTPVRPQFQRREPQECRERLRLDPTRPVILVLGGSQGASGLNRLMIDSLPFLVKTAPHWQYLHLSGGADFNSVQEAYARANARAAVHPFSSEMDLVLGAASAAVSRSGASTLAEFAAMQVPAVLIPFPHSADDHQFHNARAFADSGAAQVLPQISATAERLAAVLQEMVGDSSARTRMQRALAGWHAPKAAEEIAGAILLALGFETRTCRGDRSTNEATPRTSSSSPGSDSHPRLRFA